MSANTNTITWASGRNLRTIEVAQVALLHREGEREAGHMTIGFDDGRYRYQMGLARRPDDGRFEGTCDRIVRESGTLIGSIPVRCLLLDSLENSALVLSLSPWVDDSQQEFDWMGHFKDVQRVIRPEQEG